MIYLLAGLAVLALVLLVAAWYSARIRNRRYRIPKPNGGIVTKEQAPDLSRNERRLYAKLYSKQSNREGLKNEDTTIRSTIGDYFRGR